MSKAEDSLIAMYDARYHGAGKMRGSNLDGQFLIMVKAERLDKRTIVDFGLPSGTALFLSLARRSFDSIRECNPRTFFERWLDRLVPKNHSALFDYFERYISHIVFTFTALEAFANLTIPNDFHYPKKNREGTTTMLGKTDIERQINLDEKLNKVLPLALGVRTPNQKLRDHYRQIKTMRDRIIHLKTADRMPRGCELESVWGVMLRNYKEPFCDHAHAIMCHYVPKSSRTWLDQYPYVKVEPDHLIHKGQEFIDRLNQDDQSK